MPSTSSPSSPPHCSLFKGHRKASISLVRSTRPFQTLSSDYVYVKDEDDIDEDDEVASIIDDDTYAKNDGEKKFDDGEKKKI